MNKQTIEKEKRIAFALVLVVSTFLGAVGQLFFKIGVSSSLIGAIEFIIAGFVVYGISTLMYFYVLGRTHLSWAYSFGGLSYIFTAMLAFSVLGEAIPTMRWIGVIVIVVGVALIGAS
ncbi:MAG: hypothetical protein KGH49_00745 [Candidatus Micrarchaeota archaeon]|nr:hypothetical protein [Candidatus Micrarchaeota archaeon]